MNESDQIGLKSFWAINFGGDNRPKNDILMYDKISANMDSTGMDLLMLPGGTTPTGDNVFLYGCGPFSLKHGDRQRFSIALMMAQNLNDLLLNSETAQRVVEANYRFTQPPPQPHVVAVPGNSRVTLYWDTAAEEGIDPLLNVNDFEGYKIYRSEDYTFADVFTITDGYGVPFLGKALFDEKAKKSVQWHLPWSDSLKAIYVGGFHPVEYQGRFVKYYMGDPADMSGLRHQFVDSTVTNGKKYYYAVVAFDHGINSDNLKLPPTETQAIISRDGITQELKFDINTVAAIPSNQAPGLDTLAAEKITMTHTKGQATGAVRFQILNEAALSNSSYSISFRKIKNGTDSVLAYNILRNTPVSETIIGHDLLYVGLKHKNIVKSSVQVMDAGILEVNHSLILVDSATGKITGTLPGIIKDVASYIVRYQYYPVVNSVALAGQDNNPVFDGVRPFVTDEVLALDSLRSGFLGKNPYGVLGVMDKATLGVLRLAPLDVRITFMKLLGDTTVSGNYTIPVDSLKTIIGSTYVKVPFKIENATDTTKLTVLIKDGGVLGRWDLGDEIIVLTPPPYNQVSTNTMMGILFKPSSNVVGNPPLVIPDGTTYLAKTKKPFSVNDLFTLTTSAVTSVTDVQTDVPMFFSLEQNYPNPFNPTTSIKYFLPNECRVVLTVYNVLGQEVMTLVKGTQHAGLYIATFDASRLASGLYLYRIEAGSFSCVKKMLLIK